MTQQIEFGGQIHEFPDSFSQKDISQALASYEPPTADSRAPAVSALRGIPILGAYTDKATAALNAAAQPLFGAPGLSQAGSYGERYTENLPKITGAANQFEKEHPIGSTLGQIGAGAAALGPVGMTGIGATALGLGGRTVLGMATRGALSGAALGAADTAARGGDVGQGTALGAGVGAAFPVVGSVIGRALSPGAGVQSAERQAALRTLEAEGVQPTAGQATGSKAIQYTENELGGRKNQAMQEKALEQYTTAALRKAGSLPNEVRATPDTLDNLLTRNGAKFDAVAARNPAIPIDKQFMTDAQRIANDYQGLTGKDPTLFDPFAKGSLFQRVAIANPAGAQISGAGYQTIRSEIGRLARAAPADIKMPLYDFQRALDKAVERGLKNPTDKVAWQEARKQYKNILVVERAMGNGGPMGAAGLITPAQLRIAAQSIDKRGFKRGTSDFTDLSRAGNQVMESLPQSGTAPRAAARATPMMLAGIMAGHGLAGIPGIAAGVAAPWLTGRIAMSRPGQAYLGNQLAARLPEGGLLGRAVLPSLNESRR